MNKKISLNQITDMCFELICITKTGTVFHSAANYLYRIYRNIGFKAQKRFLFIYFLFESDTKSIEKRKKTFTTTTTKKENKPERKIEHLNYINN